MFVKYLLVLALCSPVLLHGMDEKDFEKFFNYLSSLNVIEQFLKENTKEKINHKNKEVCKHCSKQYINKAIHRIFFCENNYDQRWFIREVKTETKIIMVCKKCDFATTKHANHYQVCSKMNKVTYVKYCGICGTVFTSTADYITHRAKKNEVCFSFDSDGYCPVKGCDFQYERIPSMMKHCKNKHNEETIFEAYYNKKWYKEEKKQIFA